MIDSMYLFEDKQVDVLIELHKIVDIDIVPHYKMAKVCISARECTIKGRPTQYGLHSALAIDGTTALVLDIGLFIRFRWTDITNVRTISNVTFASGGQDAVLELDMTLHTKSLLNLINQTGWQQFDHDLFSMLRNINIDSKTATVFAFKESKSESL